MAEIAAAFDVLRAFLREAFARWAISVAQTTPHKHLQGYMGRWWFLKPRRWYAWISAGIRVHHTMLSDFARALHTHPFGFITYLMRGGYWEIRPLDPNQDPSLDATHFTRTWYGPGSILIRSHKVRHRLELEGGRSCWSFCILGRRRAGDWGFETEGGYVPETAYPRDQLVPK